MSIKGLRSHKRNFKKKDTDYFTKQPNGSYAVHYTLPNGHISKKRFKDKKDALVFFEKMRAVGFHLMPPADAQPSTIEKINQLREELGYPKISDEPTATEPTRSNTSAMENHNTKTENGIKRKTMRARGEKVATNIFRSTNGKGYSVIVSRRVNGKAIQFQKVVPTIEEANRLLNLSTEEVIRMKKNNTRAYNRKQPVAPNRPTLVPQITRIPMEEALKSFSDRDNQGNRDNRDNRDNLSIFLSIVAKLI